MTNILGSALLNLAAAFISLMGGFFVSVISARLLGPAGAGTVAQAMWVTVCASAFADRGLPQMVLRYAPALQGEHARTSFITVIFCKFAPLVTLTFAGFLGFGLYHLIDAKPDTKADAGLWILAGFVFAVYTLSAFATAAARGSGQFRETAINTSLGSGLQIPLVALGALLLGPSGVLLGLLTRYLPQVFLLRRYIRELPANSGVPTGEMSRYGRTMWISDMIDIILLMRIEYLVVGYFLTANDVGYFATSVVFAGFVSQLTFQLSPAILVGMTAARSAVENPGERQIQSYRNSMRLTALIIAPLGIGGAAVVSTLVPIVFGAAFSPAAIAASLFLLASVPTGLSVVPWAWLAAHEKSRALMWQTLISAATILLLLIAVVPAGGVLGAAWVRILTETFGFALLLRAVKLNGGPSLPWNALARTFLAAALCGTTAFLIVQAWPTLAGVLIAVASGAAVFAICLPALKLIEMEEAARLMRIVEARIPHRLHPFASGLVRLLASPN